VIEDELIIFINRKIWRMKMGEKAELIFSENEIEELGFDFENFGALFAAVYKSEVVFTVQGRASLISYAYETKEFHRVDFEVPSENIFSNYHHVQVGGALVSFGPQGDVVFPLGDYVSDVPLVKRERFFLLNTNEVLCMDAMEGARILTLNNDTLKQARSLFEGNFLSAVSQSENGTLFFGTFGEGVYVVPNLNTTNHETDELLLGITTSPANEVFVSTRSGKVFELRDSLFKIDQKSSNLDMIFYFEGGFDFYNQDNRLLYELFLPQVPAIKDAIRLNDTVVLVAFQNCLGMTTSGSWPEETNNTFITEGDDTLFLNSYQTERLHKLDYFTKEETVVFASSLGVRYSNLEDAAYQVLLMDGQELLCSDLLALEEEVLLATNQKGILKTDLTNNEVWLTEKEGLLSNSVRKLEEHNGLLYMLTAKGLQVFDLKEKSFVGLGYAEGLISNDVKNFSISDDKLWILKKHSVSSIPISSFNQMDGKIELAIDSVLLSGHSIDGEGGVYQSDENYLRVLYDYRYLETANEVALFYRLKGWSDDWQEVDIDQYEIAFKSLPPGDYELQLKTVYRDEIYLSETYAFQIDHPYYQKWWFYLVITLLVSLVVGLIAIQQIRRIRKRNEVKVNLLENQRKALQAQLKAIRAQMNPHFIFNSITSIQDLILKDEKIQSYDYLEEFSKMVRTTLSMSETEFVNVAEEIAYLEVYIKLEQLRFKDDFEFVLSNQANGASKVPSLFLQPLVENAIKHGLRHQSGLKKLSITFSEIDGMLHVEIEDNGVGRKASNEINAQQQKKYESFSTNAIKHRIGILNDQYQTNIKLEYVDLIQGTKVIVRFPLKYSNPKK
jgi:anti-sigma regulatory factor (Ser/Thr protein kinase)/uncharacterized membrane-anchored protein YhcB (DUF1043 family)